MKEGASSLINSGFYIIKRNENIGKIIEFFEDVVKTMEENEGNENGEDQNVINSKKDSLNWCHFPEHFVTLASYLNHPETCIIQHAICSRQVNDKINQIKEIHERLGVHCFTKEEESRIIAEVETDYKNIKFSEPAATTVEESNPQQLQIINKNDYLFETAVFDLILFID